MPELPEVETIRRQLSNHLPGLTLERIEVLDAKIGRFLSEADQTNIIGQKIKEIGRVAKVLLWEFENGFSLAFHLKMTGQVIMKTKHSANLPDKFTRVVLHLNKGEVVYFQDMRKFGWLKVVQNADLSKKLFKDKIGPEPLQPAFTIAYFEQILERSGKPIKVLLLDQNKIAGIGNIYANEALFLAKVNPNTKGKDLARREVVELYEQILLVLQKGIDLGGASDNSYVNAYGLKGQFQNHFLVYRQQGKSCPNCSTPIKRITQGGRGTFFCPVCQGL